MSNEKKIQLILNKIGKDKPEYNQILSLYRLYQQKKQINQQIQMLSVEYRIDEMYELYVGENV